MELVENAPPVAIDITASQAASIADTSAFWRKKLKLREEPIRLSIGRDGKYLIEVRGVAGFVRVEATTLEIAPKFINRETAGPNWRSAMWRFLAFGHGIQAITDAAGSASKTDGIADVLADLFMASLKGAAARGYPLSYRTKTIVGPFLRGRLAPRGYAKLIPPTGSLEMLAPALTLDNPTNRLLKWAGTQLAATVEDPLRRRRLLNWLDELPGVSAEAPPPRAVQAPGRHHPYLAHAVEIAKFLLDDWTAGYEAGEWKLPGFLWDAENLFERAARRLTREAVRPLGLSVSKYACPLAHLESDQEIWLDTTPDITVQRQGAPALVLDAKYKVLTNHPQNADLYQVLAGGRASAVANVGLLYPSEGSSIEAQKYHPTGSGLPKSVAVVKLGLCAFSSRPKLAALRNDLTQWIASQIN